MLGGSRLDCGAPVVQRRCPAGPGCREIQGLPFLALQGLLMLLQNLPTIHWGNEEIGLLLAEAYRLKYMFADAPNHYRR